MGAAQTIGADDFQRKVVGGKGLALIDFTAGWCPPCKALAPTVDALASEYTGRVFIAKVDIDEDGDIASKYDVNSVPTLILFRDGKNVETLVGLQSRPQIEALLARHLGTGG